MEPPPIQVNVFIPKRNKNRRRSKSLNLLAARFIKLLRATPKGEVDLNKAADDLVGKKRRIYDITNVLAGIGLIVKKSKCIVEWRGSIQERNALGCINRVAELKSELKDLEQVENMLDQQTQWVEQSIKNTKEDSSPLTYVNHEDIYNIFTGHTLLAIRAPSGAQLDVPIPKAVQNCPAMYQIHLKSNNGPMDVVFLNKSSDCSVPFVLPVPPSEDIIEGAKSAMASSVESLSEEKEDVQVCKRGILNADLVTKLIASEAFPPLLHVPPPRRDHEYASVISSLFLFDH